jgi:hypothetical protein
MKKTCILAVATLAFLAVPVASFAGGGPVGPGAWTSVCSAGATIDEASRNFYAVDGSSLFHTPPPPGGTNIRDIIARYNVTNTEIPDTPFQLGTLWNSASETPWGQQERPSSWPPSLKSTLARDGDIRSAGR